MLCTFPKSKNIRLFYLLAIYFFSGFPFGEIWAQDSTIIKIRGNIYDNESGEPLEYAMVILNSLKPEPKSDFVQSGKKGEFIFERQKGSVLKIEVFYLGYKDYLLRLGAIYQDTSLVVNLIPSATDLQEIIVKDTLPPIVYRPDTVIYNAKHFYSGRERKLNELIDNLPGLAVDENNHVTYKGKDVDAILVEGKPFFGGNSELALTGLPADAVGVVKVLENYQPLGFSLDQAGERRIAIDVKLREEKKNVSFGELAAGLGPQSFYDGRLDLFNYTPKKNLYIIGGSNNTDSELLSIQQRFQLLSGSLGIGNEDFLTRYKEISSFQPVQYSTKSNSHLVAIGADLSPSSLTTASLYGIFSHSKNDFETQAKTIYDQLSNNMFSESEAEVGNLGQTFGMLRFDVKRNFKNNAFFSAHFRGKGQFVSEASNQLYQASNANLRNSESTDQNTNFGGETVLEYVKKTKKGHTHHVNISFFETQSQENLNLVSNVPFLESLIEWPINGDEFDLLQKFRLPNSIWSFNDKYIHRFGPRIYLTSQLYLSGNKRKIELERMVDNLNSAVNLRQFEQSGKFALIVTPGDWKIVSAFDLSHQNWNLDNGVNNQYFRFLPSISLSRPLTNIGKITLDYQQILENLDYNWFFPNTFIRTFTTFQTGNPSLSPYVISQIKFDFERSQPLKFSFWGLSFRYNFAQKDNVINALELFNNERVFSFALSNNKQRSTSLNLSYNKDYSQSKLQVNIFGSQSNNFTLTAESKGLIEVNQNILMGRVIYKWKMGENSDVRMSISLTRNQFERGVITNVNYNESSSISGKFKMGNLQFFPEIETNVYQFTESPIWFIRASSSIVYQKAKSPLSFEVSGRTPLSGRNILSISQTSLFYQEIRKTTFPPYLIGKVRCEF